jgi:hypothetical protein
MEWGAVTFWGWCTIKKLLNPTITFLVFHIQILEENGSSNYVQNCLSIVQKPQGILGIKKNHYVFDSFLEGHPSIRIWF